MGVLRCARSLNNAFRVLTVKVLRNKYYETNEKNEYRATNSCCASTLAHRLQRSPLLNVKHTHERTHNMPFKMFTLNFQETS